MCLRIGNMLIDVKDRSSSIYDDDNDLKRKTNLNLISQFEKEKICSF